jgi:hypothetical protein
LAAACEDGVRVNGRQSRARLNTASQSVLSALRLEAWDGVALVDKDITRDPVPEEKAMATETSSTRFLAVLPRKAYMQKMFTPYSAASLYATGPIMPGIGLNCPSTFIRDCDLLWLHPEALPFAGIRANETLFHPREVLHDIHVIGDQEQTAGCISVDQT